MKTDFDHSDNLQEIRSALFSMADEGYKAFTVKLIPNIPASKVIGVRAPALRAYEKSIRNSREAKMFLRSLPHAYLEEDNLHALLINSCRDFDTASELAHEFLPFVDNWATCDSISPRVFAKNKEKPHVSCGFSLSYRFFKNFRPRRWKRRCRRRDRSSWCGRTGRARDPDAHRCGHRSSRAVPAAG